MTYHQPPQPADPAQLERLRELLEGRRLTASVLELDREIAAEQASDRDLEARDHERRTA